MSLASLPRRTVLSSLLGASMALSLRGAHAEGKPIRVGIMAGEDEDIWRLVSQNAQKQGLALKIVTFSDYSTPDEALASHDLDANSFQHKPFLKAQCDAHGYRITPVGDTYVAPIGLYSRKWKTLAALPKGAVIGVPNDPSNEGRALLLLQTLGFIKLSPSAGLLPTPLDITENPHEFTIRELDAGVVGRALPDLDAAVINTDWAHKAGVDVVHERLAREGVKDNPYICVIAVNTDDVQAPWVKPLVSAYQQPNIRQALIDVYANTVIPAFS
ncbi:MULTISPECIES: MetQ/NlpA family ABC transporter substrate-binding protein [Asaia]|uniref:Lipoprotein n=1 Tax=Asaia bogorensis TaxID=91915 RepID=A0A060QD64_9PROT|nr:MULTISPECIES: MetQ/NlpA family ABC transporter substrate-binding protein [Asaia]ETC98436.1 methionine ABC transporter substrate-binding protein [Asaia sp. SF2.1]CDG38870.1 Methionine ABC transporter substrate-binding protein [Asaia bogorensis]